MTCELKVPSATEDAGWLSPSDGGNGALGHLGDGATTCEPRVPSATEEAG